MKSLSLIIPTLNEEFNIKTLIERIDSTLTKNNITYELLFIDDYSTDKTRLVVESFTSQYPVFLHTKKGKKGKAFSIIQGLNLAKHDIVGYIDADLQYPPEMLVTMFDKIEAGSQVVVADRKYKSGDTKRKILSNINRTIMGKLLHGLSVDVQSGMKLFKKEVYERAELSPEQWSFDLEFLLQAKTAGYKISSVPIIFSERKSGKAKVDIIPTTLELLNNAIHLKFNPRELIPFSKKQIEKKGKGFHFKGHEFINYTSLSHKESALTRFSAIQLWVGLLIGLILVVGFIQNWHLAIVIIVSILTFIYFADLLFNLFLIIRSFQHDPEIKISEEELFNLDEKTLPTYTIFCPLYKEWQVIPQFITAMSNLDYPKEKLQVMLLLESDDSTTIEKVKTFTLPSYFDVVIVPDSKPKTKPKALNYGLDHATGEYCVIYDAEDVPDKLQLKKAIVAFRKSGPKTFCIQAKLNFYNANQNILTRVFTAEYSLWFDLVLTGLQSIHAPIPLGGTSNHFLLERIKNLKGWDSFNVTEDADLGMRIAKQGFHTAVIDSTTMEEANSNMINWFSQRSRWIKGYIQTYFVHMRRPGEFIKHWREPHVITFQLVIGGKIMSTLINPIMWIITISYFLFRSQIGHFIESFYLAPVLYMGIFSLFVGNFLYLFYYMLGCSKRGYDELVKYVVLVPFYWLAMSIAGWIALERFIRQPHYWSKTKHGFHLLNRKIIQPNGVN